MAGAPKNETPTEKQKNKVGAVAQSVKKFISSKWGFMCKVPPLLLGRNPLCTPTRLSMPSLLRDF